MVTIAQKRADTSKRHLIDTAYSVRVCYTLIPKVKFSLGHHQHTKRKSQQF